MNIEVQGSVKQKWTCRLISGLKSKTLKHLENFASFRLPLLSAMLQPCNFAKGKGACMGVSRIFDIGCSYYSKVVCHSICHFRNEKGNGTEMRRAMVSGIVSGDAGQFYIRPCSKSFRLVSEQRKTEERDFRFWPLEKWNKGRKMKEGEGKDGRKDL